MALESFLFVPVLAGKWYFEVVVRSTGAAESKEAQIDVGVASPDFGKDSTFNDGKHCWGGRIAFAALSACQVVVGVTLDLRGGTITCSLTPLLEGGAVGATAEAVPIPALEFAAALTDLEVFPVLKLGAPGTCCVVNFGEAPFQGR